MVKVLVDTNVIIDALAAREPFRADAEAILLLAAEERIAGFVTGSGMTDIYYLIRRKLSHAEALDALRTLMQTLSVVSVGEDECLDAMQAGMGDFEDAVAAVCAGRVRADFIVTRDGEFARKGCAIPVVSPAEILERLGQGEEAGVGGAAMSITSKSLQEIREIRDRWAEMPREEVEAEQRKSYLEGLEELERIRTQKEAAGEPVGRATRFVEA